MPCFAKPFAFWILICLLLLLQLFKLLWMGIESSVCLDLPQNGHAQASFGVQGFQYHTKVTAVDFIDIQSSMCGSIYQISSQIAVHCCMPSFAHKQVTVQTPHPSTQSALPSHCLGGRLAPSRPSHALLHVDRRLFGSAGRRFRVSQSLEWGTAPRDGRRGQ